MRRNAEEEAVEERRALIGSPDAIHKQQKIETEGDLAQSAESVTASLQRTRQQMTQVTDSLAFVGWGGMGWTGRAGAGRGVWGGGGVSYAGQSCVV